MLASLPTPKVMDEHGQVIESQIVEEEEPMEEVYPAPPTPMSETLQTAMPWAISLIFHLAIFLVMVFAVWSYTIVDMEKVIIPDATLVDRPSGMLNPLQDRPDMEQTTVSRQVKAKEKKAEEISISDLESEQDMAIIGVGGASGAPLVGLHAEAAGPQSDFMGLGGGNARKIVYVIDRSGSMSDPELFDTMKAELMKSIAGLDPRQQYFHVIFFSSGQPVENPPRRLVPATPEFKQVTYDFLSGILPEGATNPSPALMRAFQVQGGPPELIYVLTDGDFDETILYDLRKWNPKKRTKINTIAFAYKTGEDLLKKIAEENGGRYRFVSMDEILQRTF
jgi:hypothetical protein